MSALRAKRLSGTRLCRFRTCKNTEDIFVQYDDPFQKVKTGDLIGSFTVSEAAARYAPNTEEDRPNSALYEKEGYLCFVPDAFSLDWLPVIAESPENFYALISPGNQGDFRYDWDGKKTAYLNLSQLELHYGKENIKTRR